MNIWFRRFAVIYTRYSGSGCDANFGVDDLQLQCVWLVMVDFKNENEFVPVMQLMFWQVWYISIGGLGGQMDKILRRDTDSRRRSI